MTQETIKEYLIEIDKRLSEVLTNGNNLMLIASCRLILKELHDGIGGDNDVRENKLEE